MAILVVNEPLWVGDVKLEEYVWIAQCLIRYSKLHNLTEVTVIHSRCNITRLENNLVFKIHSVHVLQSCILKSLLRSIDRLELSKEQRETRVRFIKYASNESLYLL